MPPIYKHTQRGTVILVAIGCSLAIVAIAASAGGNPRILLPVSLILALSAVLAASLTVEVDKTELRWKFGPGLIHKRVPVADIVSVEVVRNRWWHGWGIHITPHGWLYNVSGMRGVEVRLRNGKTFRLGSDEPEALARAIRAAMQRDMA
jgi:hypothetical protein